MLQYFLLASTEQVNPVTMPSIWLIVACATALGVGLIVPQQAAESGPIQLAVRRESIFPAAAVFDIFLIFTLTMRAGIAKARLSPA